MIIKNIEVQVINGNLPTPYIESELDDLKMAYARSLDRVEFEINPDGETVTQRYWFKPIPFDRIRRITGYLGNTNNWGDAKQAELRDRVTHVNGKEARS